ncbi:MAG: M13 family metallopeptidase [Acidobacteriaceae bacterium]
MRSWSILAVVLLCGAALFAQAAKEPARAPASFDKSAFDTAVNPCQDFYEFACGGWRKANPIPSDKSRWGRFNELDEYNQSVLHDILEKAAVPGKHGAIETKVGDFYAACMDEKKADALGAKPIQPQLDEVAKIANTKQLMLTIAALHNQSVPALFRFTVGVDQHNASQHLPDVDQGGLTLPDRDYYLKDDAKSVETREKYVAHVQKMFELLGEKPEQAAKDSKTVMDIETQLAKASMDRVMRRDPKNSDHIVQISELLRSAPNFNFPDFFPATGVGKFDRINISNPAFFKDVNPFITSIPLDNWKTYLRWKVLDSAAPWLSKPFFEEDFDFGSRYMTGAKEPEVRWKRCTRLTDRSLGEALGRLYVDQTFGAEGKERTLKMVHAIEHQMNNDIHNIEWMSPETKKQALTKLEAVMNKIGYPDKWKDYTSVKVTRDDLLGNLRRARKFEIDRNHNKLNKPVDRTEWGMTPPTVNAYYNPFENNINFPAGILQPPFFSKQVDDAVNLGGIGVVIGHELTHGFDDQGRKFDAQGNLTDWWTPADAKGFEERAQCIADEYSNFVAVKDDKGEVKLNGKLTLGENTADNGGLHLAFLALEEIMGDKMNVPIDGYTAAQRFFIGYGQIWCQNQTDQVARQLAIVDPHSPGKYRVNGVVQNSPEFQKAFSCKAGDPMVSAKPCRVW